MSGEKVYEIDNLYQSEEQIKRKEDDFKEELTNQNNGDQPRQKKQFSNEDVGYEIRLVGILAKERRWKKKKVENEDSDDDYGN